jgi:hypothetical protein
MHVSSSNDMNLAIFSERCPAAGKKVETLHIFLISKSHRTLALGGAATGLNELGCGLSYSPFFRLHAAARAALLGPSAPTGPKKKKGRALPFSSSPCFRSALGSFARNGSKAYCLLPSWLGVICGSRCWGYLRRRRCRSKHGRTKPSDEGEPKGRGQGPQPRPAGPAPAPR